MEKRHTLVELARQLRRSQTEAERVLWGRLRNRQLEGVKFRRQQPIGRFIVDFASLEQDLVIEIDGGQHAREPDQTNDRERASWLEQQGYRVLRFWDNEVLMNLECVLERIREALG
ncbi:MAG: endonuclease domain-containing protein [Candidatus Acetothermia bacterium]|nr:endonuclease domain-containing protein [Candidatus Acetothermia bacterium]